MSATTAVAAKPSARRAETTACSGSPSTSTATTEAPSRANSATDLLLRRLPGAPVLTADSATTLIGRTFKPANDAIQRLVQAGILYQITVGRRNRAYEAPEIIDAFTDLERQLASPAGNTRSSPPSRPTPRRRRAQTA